MYLYYIMVDFCSSMCISLRLDTLSIASVFARVFHMTVDQYEPMSNCTLAITIQKGPSEMHRHTRGLRLVLAVAAAVQPTLRNVHVTLLLLRHTDLRGSMLCKTTLPDAHWPHVEQRRRCNRATQYACLKSMQLEPRNNYSDYNVKLCHY